MKFADLYNYKPLHDLFTPSRVRQTASRITQMGKLGNYNATTEPDDVALFLYVLAASQGTRFVFNAVMQEANIVSPSGSRFVADLGALLMDQNKLDKVKKVVIGSSISIIEYTDRYKELFTLGDNFDLGRFEQFDRAFLKELAASIAIKETVEE